MSRSAVFWAVYFLLSLSLPVRDERESSGAAVLARPQGKRLLGPWWVQLIGSVPGTVVGQ